MSGQLIQFFGSLIAILVLAGLARWLRLGPEKRLHKESEVREAAQEAVDGFDPVHVAIDRGGRGAVLSDSLGRILLLKPHGTHVAGRILGNAAHSELDGNDLVIDSGERRFGSVRLSIEDAPAWVKRIGDIG